MCYYQNDPIKLINLLHELLTSFGFESTISNIDNYDIQLIVNGFKKDDKYSTQEWVYTIKSEYNNTIGKYVDTIEIDRLLNHNNTNSNSKIYIVDTDNINGIPIKSLYSEKNWVEVASRNMIPGFAYDKILKFLEIPHPSFNDSYDNINRHIKLFLSGI